VFELLESKLEILKQEIGGEFAEKVHITYDRKSTRVGARGWMLDCPQGGRIHFYLWTIDQWPEEQLVTVLCHEAGHVLTPIRGHNEMWRQNFRRCLLLLDMPIVIDRCYPKKYIYKPSEDKIKVNW